MTLPTGQISMSQVNTELGIASTTLISLNQANVRTLAGVPSGQISMSNLQGKSNQLTGQQTYTSPGTYTWVCPASGVSTISCAVLSGGAGGTSLTSGANSGGGGGGLAYANNVSVTPGATYQIVVGYGGNRGASRSAGSSYINLQPSGTNIVYANGPTGQSGGTPAVGTGFNGGDGAAGGGGGAAGYSGNGGRGSNYGNGNSGAGGGGGGGAGGAYTGGGGGGVNYLGQGASGAGGVYVSDAETRGGAGGSGGSTGGTGGRTYDCCGASANNGGNGGTYGGGGGFTYGLGDLGIGGGVGSSGWARILYPGSTRSYPSTNTGNL